jgi:hypothetical protein
MVHGERAIGARVWARCGGRGMGCSSGDSFDALKEALEDIWLRGRVHSGVERIASCLCWR